MMRDDKQELAQLPACTQRSAAYSERLRSSWKHASCNTLSSDSHYSATLALLRGA